MEARLLGIIIAIAFFSVIAHAAPTITGVSGTVSQGQIHTISGSNLLSEDKTEWAPSFRTGTMYGFEGPSYSVDGYDIAPDMHEQDRSYDSTIFLLGSKSYKGHIHGASSNCPTGNLASGLYVDRSQIGNAGNDFYVRLYSRWESLGAMSIWPQSHIKMLDIQGTGSQWYLQPSSGSGLPNTMNMVYDGNNHLYQAKDFLEENRWYCFEARFKIGSPYNFTAWVDGKQLGSVQPASVGTASYILFNMINACGTSSDFDLTNWMDGFTVSTARIHCSAIVEIGNNPDYGLATKEYQEPIYLSDGTIQIKADLTGLGTGPYYLWVTNNRQERSDAYPLSGATQPVCGANGCEAGETCTTCPQDCGTCQCTPSWVCSDWSVCLSNQQTRTCTDSKNCGVTTGKPATTQSCTSCIPKAEICGNGIDEDCNDADLACAAATALFQENFEDTNFASRGWYDITSGTLSTDHVAGSTKSLQCTYNQGATGCTVPSRHLFTETDSVYVSYWVKYSSNWQGSNQPYHPHEFGLLTNENDQWVGPAYTHLTGYIEQNEGWPQLALQDGENIDQSRINQDLSSATENRGVCGCNGVSSSEQATLVDCYDNGDYWNGKVFRANQIYFSDSAGPYYKNDWHHVEAYFKLNTISNNKGQPDGILKYWYDGNLIIDRSNIIMRTAEHPSMKWNQLMFGPWMGDGSPVQQTMWVDNLTVATARPSACSPDWVCGNWSACANNQQSRTCTDSNSCGTAAGKPGESQSCTVVCIHDADIPPCDGCVMQVELQTYITKWKSGQVTLAQLMEAIRLWKQGC